MRNKGQLEVALRGDLEIIMTRRFNAPRQLVFDAMTKPEYVKQWLWGPDGWTMTECDTELAVGGSFRYFWRGLKGRTLTIRGVFKEIEPPKRFVRTELMEGPGFEEVLITALFTEEEGVTTFTTTILCPSREIRDAMIKSGMERGVQASYNRLSTMLAAETGVPQIVEALARPMACIQITVPREEIRSVMGPGLAELTAALAEQGIEPVGPWFTHHLKPPGSVFDFEICLPVATAVKPAGRVQPGEVPAATFVRTVYMGSYEGLGSAWGKFDAWIKANGLRASEELWECYLNSSPGEWRTELTRLLLLD